MFAVVSSTGFSQALPRAEAAYYRIGASPPTGSARPFGSSLPTSGRREMQAREWQLFLEPVTHPIQRLDHVERVIGLLEFLAQSLDVAVDRAVVDIDLVVISGVHQRIAA